MLWQTTRIKHSRMFVSDHLIFTELHKTAGSHLGKLLQQYVGGEQVGKHNRIPEALRSRFVAGSIRNPWDWYVSLWGYGCDGKGSVFGQTSKRNGAYESTLALAREMDSRAHRNPFTILKQWHHERTKPVTEWRSTYQDVNNSEQFRKWIKLMCDPSRKFDIGEGFGHSPISEHHGLLSYRFFKLFSNLDSEIYANQYDVSKDGLQSLWQEHGFVDAFIRQESLEDDFIAAVTASGVTLDAEQIEQIHAGKNNKTNTSSRKKASDYYDDETAALVAQRESFIIDKFGYRFNDIT